MKFAENRPVKIVMLGAGGTGGHIAPHLYRLLYALERPVRFIICDGDIVEEKNLVRQNFTPADLGENKAKVLAERYSSVFGMETEYVPEFIESGERLLSMLRTFWLRLTASRPQGMFEKPRTEAPVEEPSDTPEDAETKANIAKIVQEVLAQQAAEKAACADDANDADDFELQRMIGTFKLLRDKGYTMRILPGTPEENAPVFDFAAESIQPAA